jgi:hypothetical protein
LLGCVTFVTVSNRLVRGVINDTNAYYSYHSDKQNPIPSEQAQRTAYPHVGYDYDDRYVAPAFRPGCVTRVHGIADTVLANSLLDASLLHFSYSSYKNSFAAKKLDLMCELFFK